MQGYKKKKTANALKTIGGSDSYMWNGFWLLGWVLEFLNVCFLVCLDKNQLATLSIFHIFHLFEVLQLIASYVDQELVDKDENISEFMGNK